MNEAVASLRGVVRCRSRQEFESFCESPAARQMNETDEAIVIRYGGEPEWAFPGFSILAGQAVEFLVDQQSGGYFDGAIYRPNLRERLVCPLTQLNNRQRLVCTLVRERAYPGAQIYLMEQVTPVYAWAEKTLTDCTVIGSEYLGFGLAGGEMRDGLRHESVEQLSFETGSLDMIVSNEVLEHVPNPALAFAECARALRPGGRAVITIPFSYGSDSSVVRATMDLNGDVTNLLEPVYHGNPVSDEGSLVFTDFGWDITEQMRTAGFSDCWMDLYHSVEYGHLGACILVMEAVR